MWNKDIILLNLGIPLTIQCLCTDANMTEIGYNNKLHEKAFDAQHQN